MTDHELPARLNQVLDRAEPLAKRFSDAGFRLYLVGGVVRDHLLGVERDDSDIDATTDARPDTIKRLVANLADAVWTQGERFGTIGCWIDGLPYEITTHRAEVYDESSRKPVVSFGDHIDDDLARRDFTVNAMAVEMGERRIIDPHGGRADLECLVLRTPLDPEVSFSDDPLRMLRAARFHASYGLTPVESLVSAIVDMGDRMAIVSAERIRDELQKLLLLDSAAVGLRLLDRTHLLGRVMEALTDLTSASVDSAGRRVEASRPEAAHRWAALVLQADDSEAALRPLKPSGALARDVAWLVGASPWLEDGVPADEETLRRAAANSPSPQLIEDRLDFVAAIRRADGDSTDDVVRAGKLVADLRAREPDLDSPIPVLSGKEVCRLLLLEPGPDVGVALGWLADQRFAAGPVDTGRARQRLVDWWPTRRTT